MNSRNRILDEPRLTFDDERVRILEDLLGQAYQTSGAVRRLAEEVSGFPTEKVVWDAAAQNLWRDVLRNAAAAGVLRSLVGRVVDDAQVAGFRQKIIDIVSRLDQTISDSRDQEKAGTVAGKANESQLGEVIQFRPRREGVRSPGQNPPDLWHNFFDVLLGTSFDSRDPATFAADTMALRMMLLGAHPRAPVQPDRIAEIVDELRRCLQNAVTAGTSASELARCADSCEQFRGWLVGITNQRRSIT